AAGQVMRHLDFVHQAFCADWRVRFISVTEAWAQFALAGPRARAVLDSILDQPVGDFPFMAAGPVRLGGVEARLFRISFSGEEGYEIAVPTRYGEALFRDLVARAETMGGGPYGMEALNVLRIEKGFITHAEINGRVTAFDIGLSVVVGVGVLLLLAVFHRALLITSFDRAGAAAMGVPISEHCDEARVEPRRLDERGPRERSGSGLPGQPEAAETTAIARNIALCEATGADVSVCCCHCSNVRASAFSYRVSSGLICHVSGSGNMFSA
ncbi:MAG: hypothetical protein HC767_15050, partial [Akkermansiaceae bacterium]|nr:hypothetical protein [Akkermansiaceae bacterium]